MLSASSICRSAACERIRDKPRRMIAWSSAMSMRVIACSEISGASSSYDDKDVSANGKQQLSEGAIGRMLILNSANERFNLGGMVKIKSLRVLDAEFPGRVGRRRMLDSFHD